MAGQFDRWNLQFSLIPFPLLDAMIAGRVPYAAVALYAALDRYRRRETKEAWPGMRTLQKDLGMSLSLSTMVRLFSCLISTGFIAESKSNNPSKPTIYTLLYAPEPKPPRVVKNGTRESTCTKRVPKSGGGGAERVPPQESSPEIQSFGEPREPRRAARGSGPESGAGHQPDLPGIPPPFRPPTALDRQYRAKHGRWPKWSGAGEA